MIFRFIDTTESDDHLLPSPGDDHLDLVAIKYEGKLNNLSVEVQQFFAIIGRLASRSVGNYDPCRVQKDKNERLFCGSMITRSLILLKRS